MSEGQCVEYPDIFRRTPDNATAAQREAIARENEVHEILYKAVAHILKTDFGMSSVPFAPSDFPGRLSADEQTRFVAIYGLLLADNYDNPSMGRTVPMADDLVIAKDTEQPPKATILVTRRFADAVVSAVKEFTAVSELHTKVFGLLREEATRRSAGAQRQEVQQ